MLPKCISFKNIDSWQLKKVFPASRRQIDAQIAQIFIPNSSILKIDILQMNTSCQCGRQKVHLCTHSHRFWIYVNKDLVFKLWQRLPPAVWSKSRLTRALVPVVPLGTVQPITARVEEESCPLGWTPTPSASSPSLHSCSDSHRRRCGRWSACAAQSSGVVLITFFLRTETRS